MHQAHINRAHRHKAHISKPLLLLIIILSLTTVLALSACGKDAVSAPGVDDDPTLNSDPRVGALGFTYDGNPIIPGEPFAEIRAALGDTSEKFQLPSPLSDKPDMVYYYPGFTINTYVDSQDGVEKILSVVLSDDTVSTDKGAYIGMSMTEAVSLYGEGSKHPELPEYTYKHGDIRLRIVYDEREYVIDIRIAYAPIQDIYDSANDQLFDAVMDDEEYQEEDAQLD